MTKPGSIVVAMVIGALLASAAATPALSSTAPERRGSAPPERISALALAGGEQLAAAMNVPADTLRSADLMGSDPQGVGVESGSLGDFPSAGSSFAVLSTGLETGASTPNDADDLSSELDGLNNDQGEDLVRLHLALHSPQNARCLAFDVGFLSEEFPEFVGSEFNDTFTAQLGTSTLSTDGSTVIAPGNFALDSQGNVLDVNTVFGVTPDTGTTYDGGTPRLRASTPVDGDVDLDLYLSIQDLSDSIYDSAAFLDNFFWSSDETCRFGSSQDSDGDGLLDEWETGGLHSKIDGLDRLVDLPAMGADPQVPDVFVEIDYMVAADHSHRPDPAAIATVIDSFAAHGVHLHVDYGPEAPLRWGPNAAGTWGDLSQAEPLPHQDHLGDHGLFGLFDYSWDDFDGVKADHFDEGRAAVFHYNVWAHLQSDEEGTSSGLSRGAVDDGGASDFIVSLGGFSDQRGTTADQTGTFMHELGHNLGLGHGGGDNRNYKPNYLSLMNYSFQLSGLPAGNPGRVWDYSTDRLFELQESGGLDEADGIHITDPGVQTVHWGCGGSRHVVAADSIDWNCDGDATDLNVTADVNRDGDETVLEGNLDWGFLTYTGGAIGLPGSLRPLPPATLSDEYTREQFQQDQATLVRPVLGTVTVPSAPVRVGVPLATSATFTVTSGAATQTSAVWAWGDGTTSVGPVTGAGANGAVTGSHTYTRAGVYPVTLTLTAPDGSVTSPPATVVAYDPAAGALATLATVPVPAGSYAGAPALAGKVAIGVAAAYPPGHDQPVAALALRWPAAGLTILSSSAHWLVVDGKTARLAGQARIGGAGSYEFELAAVDGAPDKLRLVVWDPAIGGQADAAAVVFDTNRPSKAPTALSKGQVIIT